MYGFASEQFTNWNFGVVLYVFLFGPMAYFANTEKKRAQGIVYGIIIVVVGYISGNHSGYLIFGASFYFLIILFDIIPIKWGKAGRIISALSSPAYSIYLTHWFVIILLKNFSKAEIWIIGYLSFLLICFVIGDIAYRFVERSLGEKCLLVIRHVLRKRDIEDS